MLLTMWLASKLSHFFVVEILRDSTIVTSYITCLCMHLERAETIAYRLISDIEKRIPS